MMPRWCSLLAVLLVVAPATGAAQPDEDEARPARPRPGRAGSAAAAAPEADAAAPVGPERVALDELMALAVRQSTTLALANAGREIAILQREVASAPDQWRVSLGADLTKKPYLEANVLDQSTVRVNGGASKRLPTGGTFQLGLGTSLFTSRLVDDPTTAGDESAVTGEQAVTSAQLDLRQPLLRGRGGVGVADRSRAEVSADRATLDAYEQGAATVRDLVSAYWELVFAHAAVGVRQTSTKLAREQLRITNNIARTGVLPENARKAAVYGVALREEAELRAGLDVENASIALRRLAGLPIGPGEILLEPSDALVVTDRQWDLDDALRRARKRNPRIAAARLGIKLSQIDVDVAANGVFPRLDLSLALGAAGVGADLGSSFETLQGSERSFQVTAGVAMSYEIGGAARAAAAAARIAHTAGELTAAEVEREITAAVIQAVHQVQAAQKRAEVAARAVEMAEANLGAEQVAFRADRSTNFQVFQRQAEVDEARLLQARSVVDYYKAEVQVEYLTGGLLTRYGIEVTKPRR
ncbi:MAG: TolC family protein [Kofleriaceae bacterium]|jgi:outer membrane protein TolC|nr:TolC family protein [Kofleriaceae bacterium]